MGTSRIPGPICGSENPLVKEEGTLPLAAMPIPGPEGVDWTIGDSEYGLHDVMEAVAEDSTEEGHEAFWVVFDDQGGDWVGTSIPQEFRMRVSGQTFFMKKNATKHLFEYALAHFAGPGTFHANLSFPMSALAGGFEKVMADEVLKPLMEGKTKRVGTEDEPLRVGDWEFSFEFVDDVVEVLHAVCKRSIASV